MNGENFGVSNTTGSVLTVGKFKAYIGEDGDGKMSAVIVEGKKFNLMVEGLSKSELSIFLENLKNGGIVNLTLLQG